ncbi:MAG: FecR domain-containing protein [Chitinophagaceae bacterium]|nr:FecR domain-containing protein [Chitinophagaceae bacterium]
MDELQQLILEHSEWQLAIQNLEDLWKHQQKNDDYMQGEDAYMLHLHRINELNIPFGDLPAETPVVQVKNNRKWYWVAAAIFAVTAGIFWITKNTVVKSENEKMAGQVNEVSTRPGSKSKIQLPDGSTVWLNADSKLDYDKNFNVELREVHLTGEAFLMLLKTHKNHLLYIPDLQILKY